MWNKVHRAAPPPSPLPPLPTSGQPHVATVAAGQGGALYLLHTLLRPGSGGGSGAMAPEPLPAAASASSPVDNDGGNVRAAAAAAALLSRLAMAPGQGSLVVSLLQVWACVV